MSIPASSRGISLLEVLVALTIFSIGAIGLSGWMTLAARATHAGYLRTQASFLAGDMVERMRANPAGVRADAYEGEAQGGATACGIAAACAPGALAAHDRAMWAVRLQTVLPNGKGTIHCDRHMVVSPAGTPTPFSGLCTMTVRWLERGAGDRQHRAAAMRSLAWVFQP